MLKVLKKINKLHILLGLCLVFILSIAAVPEGPSRLDSLFIILDPDGATPDVTPGADDLYVYGTSEFDDAMRVDGAIDANSTMNISGAITATGGMTLTSTGEITGTNIADVTRSFTLWLPAGMEDGGADLGGTSTPTLAELDNVPSVQWDDSGETTAAQWTFRVPSDYVQGGSAGVYAIVSSDNVDGTDIGLGYAWWINGDDIAFDAARITEDTAMCTSMSLDTSCEVLDLSAGVTAIAAFTAGAWVTFDVWNANITTNDNTELKGLEFYYTSSQ